MASRAAGVLGAAALLAACAGTPVAEPRSAADQRRIDRAIAGGRVLLGMTTDEVRRAWGAPSHRKRVSISGRERTMWTYPSTALYFDREGYLVHWDSPLD